jgi:hypothetical protein
MFNNLFNSITFYIILGLSLSTLGFGYLSYSLSNDKAIAIYALKESKEAIAEYEKSLNLKYLSCERDSASVVEVEADKKVAETKTNEVSDKIEKLRRPQVKQEIIKNENLKETNVLPDDGLLSANLISLLRENYCSVYPDDSECVSK